MTNEGEKNIEDIEVGDMVLAKDENNPDGELAYKEVTNLYRNQRDDIIKLYVGEQIIETTDNHPFWVEGKGWVFADELQVGDKLQKADGSNLTIEKLEFIMLDKPVTVYNFTVADYNTYYVTDLGIWVHNTECNVSISKSAARTAKKLSPEAKKGYDAAIKGLESGDLRGLHAHALSGKRKGQWAVDIKGSGRKRGDARVIYTKESNGDINVIEVITTHDDY
nr:polymorphic toxin-type HINT domain-containing protein [Paenibacillus sp. 481]